MEGSKWAIIAIGYNRPKSVERLLNTICKAKYSENVDLILSVDYSAYQEEHRALLNAVEWPYGKKIFRGMEERQGLRKHVISCGQFTNIYENVIVLEDDLMVAEGFFEYAKGMMQFYGDDDDIAGVSLYSHKRNPGNGRRFEPQKSAADVYLLQYAQSWGQVWNRRMWNEFVDWYNENPDINNIEQVPKYVREWDDRSWLKYYISFVVLNNKYFVYPYDSLSTNCSEAGEHTEKSSNMYCVALTTGIHKYQVVPIGDLVKYDVYFEREFDNQENPLYEYGDVEFDLYGMKTQFSNRYVVSTGIYDFHIIKKFGLIYHPQEVNCQIQTEGQEIFLYDTKRKESNKYSNWREILKYDGTNLSRRKAISYSLSGLGKMMKQILIRQKHECK